MSRISLALSSLLLELSAWYLIAGAGSDDALLRQYFGVHFTASMLLATLVIVVLPSRITRPRAGVWLLVFAISAAIPGFGFLSVFIGVLALPFLPRLSDEVRFGTVRLPELDPHERKSYQKIRPSGIRQFLTNESAPADQRVKALVALQHAPTRTATPLLRELLGSETEDLRLLAYGMLDAHEKRINADIHEERQRLEWLAPGEARATCAQRLSDLYWELVYQGLAQGALREHALNESLRYVNEVARQGRDLATQHLRRAHIYRELHDFAAAEAAFEAAHQAGMSASRMLPYMAEIAFERRDYAAVRQHVAQMGDVSGLPRLAALKRLWCPA